MHPSSASGADQLLASLDPEQRAVAVALQGPVRVLAGAGTGKTRAITHRIAYGVASGVYNPTEVLAVTFTTRAAGEMRTRLRGLGAGAVQARTFHSAALRQARFFWPKVYGGELPALLDSKLGLIGNAARRNRVGTDQSTLRDLASEVEWAKVSNVRPDDYARSPPRAAGRSPARTPRPWPGCSRRTRTSSVARAGWTWRTCCCARPRCWPRTSGSPPRSAGSTAGSWSTSSRTSARSRPRCWTCGSAVATTSAWWATPPRRSTPSRARAPPTCWTSPPSTAGPPRSSWSATTAPPRRSSTSPTGCSRAPAAPASSSARSPRPAPR